MKILIIEDDASIRQTLQELLTDEGHEVLAASNGTEGVRLAEARPDFIFCDVSMPGMDGFAVIEAIRRQADGELVPFVFLTGGTERAMQRRGMALGADDYITKPFSPDDILSAITARVRRQRPLRERIEALVNQRRAEVGADWSHEMLTPLHATLGGLELLESEAGTVSREEFKQIVAIIRAGAERQEKLSRKLVRYFDLERVKDSLRPEGGYRCEAAPAITAGARQATLEARREADLTLRADPGTVALPEIFLTGAVAELVRNAFRFSAPGQPVTVSGSLIGNHYWVEVIDQGPGMTREERSRVTAFTRFPRGTQDHDGLGLGLATARSVAQLAGGSLCFDDGPGNRGLRVALRLPLA